MISSQTIQDMKHWRRDFHAHPELAYEEHRTSSIVEQHLRDLGAEVHTGIAKTGVVGVFDFGDGPSIGIRADMDALPMQEHTDHAYKSKTAGKMHACGHDGHTSMAMGAAAEIAKLQSLRGKAVFIYQPAEENEGGAKAMVDDGLFERFPMERVFGLHNMPGIPVGHVGVAPGPVSASFDTFDMTVKGQGGHGAMPNLTRDPIAATGALISAINTIVARNIDPLDSAVISLGTTEAEGAFNIIPDMVALSGSTRSFSIEVQKLLQNRLRAVCRGIGMAYDVDVQIQIDERYPPVINDAETVDLFVSSIADHPDLTFVDDIKPVMGSEDFSFFSQAVPGCFFLIGNGETAGLHSPTYDFSDESLEVGAGIWVALAQHILSS